MLQTTIAKPVDCSGIGLHSGRKVRLSLHPAPEDTGILFTRAGGDHRSFIRPEPHSVVCTALATTIGGVDCRISTVEHLLAAIRGMDIDNVRIEVDADEVPIMDGSAASFVYLLRMAGVCEQKRAKRVLALKKPIEFKQDGRCIAASPHPGVHVDYTIRFDHPLISRQRIRLDLTPDVFQRRVAKARTFGFLREVEYMRANGLARGGSLENAVVLDEYGVLNEEGLRFKDEFVRHKVLDFIGDMAVLSAPLWGSFTIFAGGHGLHNAFVRYIHDNAEEYLEEIVLDEPEAAAACVEAMAEASAKPLLGMA